MELQPAGGVVTTETEEATSVQVEIEEETPDGDLSRAVSGALPALPPALATRRRWMLALALGFCLIVAVALPIGLRQRIYRSSDSIVLADFTNTTGDPVFDDTLRQGLSVQLEQSPFLSLVSDHRIQQTLRLMGQPADAKLTPEIARDLCQRTLP